MRDMICHSKGARQITIDCNADYDDFERKLTLAMKKLEPEAEKQCVEFLKRVDRRGYADIGLYFATKKYNGKDE
jgi:hypothetical protein